VKKGASILSPPVSNLKKLKVDPRIFKTALTKLRTINKRHWLWIIPAAVSLIVLMVAAIPKPMRIAWAEVKKGEFIVDVRTRGEIDALRSTNVSIPSIRRRVSLQIVDMVPEGTMVKKGDFLFQLDKSSAQQSVDQARDALASAQAELSTQKAQIASTMAQLQSEAEGQKYKYEQAKLNLRMMEYEAEIKKRDAELSMKQAEVALAKAEESIKSQTIVDKATLMKAQLAVEQAEIELKDDEDALTALTVVSPLDGLVVYQEFFSSGTLKKVQVGDSPFFGQSIIKIPDLSKMMVKTTVNEVQISQLDRGQNAVITVDALEGKTYYGRISHLATLAQREQTTNINVFNVEVRIDSTDGQLRPGMTCDCQIITGWIKKAMSVPIQSVFQKADTTVVYVMSAGGPKMRKIRLGAKGSNFVVVEKGLEEGEKISLRDPMVPLETIGGQTETAAPKQQTTPSQQTQQQQRGGPRM